VWKEEKKESLVHHDLKLNKGGSVKKRKEWKRGKEEGPSRP